MLRVFAYCSGRVEQVPLSAPCFWRGLLFLCIHVALLADDMLHAIQLYRWHVIHKSLYTTVLYCYYSLNMFRLMSDLEIVTKTV